ncbi:MAG TPA: acylneuraminate cytidylyltransferase, partial [Desulfobacterales bacterium]|nr:acylneuraminate cytidylyltransferase [Desulfobacterales bacterium]
MKVTAIIQARMGSTRLPGKVMKHLTGKTVLQHVIDRVASARLLDEVIVATTISPQDDIIVTEAQKAGAKIFRGSEDDVLARYYHAAKTYKAEIIVRVTSDCPLFDPQILDEMLGIFLKENANGFNLDYMSNSLQPTFPRGLDAEIFTMRVLTKTFHEADKDYEREHVT